MTVNRMRISNADVRIVVLIEVDTRKVETAHIRFELHPEDSITFDSNLQLFAQHTSHFFRVLAPGSFPLATARLAPVRITYFDES